MFSGPESHRVSPWALTAIVIVSVSVTVLFAAPAGASNPLAGPGFTYMSQESVEGVTQVSVSYQSGGAPVRGVIYLPPGSGQAPGILLNHDGQGVDAELGERARDLAREGYVVFTPEYRATSGSLGKTQENPQEVADVLAGAEAFEQHPRVSDEKLAILGTSHGGFVALLAVMEDPKQFKCVAQASGAIDVPRTAKQIKLPILLQHGWKDQVVEIGDAMYLGAEMRRGGNSTAQLHEYSLLGHNLWFANDPGSHSSDEVSQADWAWDDLTTFLDRYMKRNQASVRPQTTGRPTVKAGMGGGGQ